ncbi:MAG: hypothetical protein U0168_20210 [Nannocystaceae bacterium]
MSDGAQLTSLLERVRRVEAARAALAWFVEGLLATAVLALLASAFAGYSGRGDLAAAAMPVGVGVAFAALAGWRGRAWWRRVGTLDAVAREIGRGTRPRGAGPKAGDRRRVQELRGAFELLTGRGRRIEALRRAMSRRSRPRPRRGRCSRDSRSPVTRVGASMAPPRSRASASPRRV